VRALHFAAQHVDVVRVLVEAGADVEAQTPLGSRPLHAAAQDGHVEVVRTLLEVGADVEAQFADGARLLHRAAQFGHVEVVRTLLEAGADAEAPGTDGARPLHYAANGGSADTIGALLELGVDTHVVDEDGALHCMMRAARRQCSCCWMQGLSSTDATPSVLRLFSRQPAWGYVPAVTALVQAGACPDASDAVWWIELIVKAVEGDEEAVTALVAAAAELTRRLGENGLFARTAVQMAELAHPEVAALRLAPTRA
jgi:ankyrin repeat protein